MTQNEALNSSQINEFLSNASREHAEVVLCYTQQGKWHREELFLDAFSGDYLTLKGEIKELELTTYQPVGICIQTGYYKYLFETSVSLVQSLDSGIEVQLDIPEKVDRMQRRAFDRQPVPGNLKVKVLFWHRGYMDDVEENPIEQYWQGRLFNLSAGGAQITVEMEQKDYYKVGQLVGIQFTPMSYEKPFLLEAHVRYLMIDPDTNEFRVGVEFLGLEASPEGRQTLHRLLEITEEYERMNQDTHLENHSVS